LLGDGFETRERTACRDAGVFEKRGIEQESAAIDEGVAGGFEGLATAATCRGMCQDPFVELQVGLKFERGSHIPALLTSERGEKFAAKGGGIFAGHRFGSAIFFRRGDGTFADQVESLRAHGDQSFALQQGQEIFIETRVDLQAVAAVVDNVGIDEAGNGALADQGVTEVFGEGSGAIGASGFGFGGGGHVKSPIVAALSDRKGKDRQASPLQKERPGGAGPSWRAKAAGSLSAAYGTAEPRPTNLS